GSADFVDARDVYAEIGYDYDDIIKVNQAFKNTCAVRMSLALLKCNVPFDGRFIIKAGAYKGRKIESGAKLLADQLYKSSAFGKAEIYTDRRSGGQALRNRRGVVFFNVVNGYGGGHIDLLEPEGNNAFTCHSMCLPDCKEIWFWELK
ncbi:T6SS effector amidase Tae4 family protein, partial [Cronobacter sakazakii]